MEREILHKKLVPTNILQRNIQLEAGGAALGQFLRRGLLLCCLGMLLPLQMSAQAQESSTDSAANMDSESAHVEQVNINQASADMLAEVLDGIGASRAEAIVKYREQHGRFQSLQDLMAVTGVGELTVMRNEARIVFD